MGFSETMKAIADPQRREMLSLVKKQRMSAGEIATQFPNLSAATVSYHLSLLKKSFPDHRDEIQELHLL